MPTYRRHLSLRFPDRRDWRCLLPGHARPGRRRQRRLLLRQRRLVRRPGRQQQRGVRRQRRLGTAGTGGSSAGSGGSAARQRRCSGGTGGSGGSAAGSGGSGAGSGGASGAAAARRGSGGSGGSAAEAAPGPRPAPARGTNSTTGPLPPGMRKVVILHDANAGGSAGDPSRKSMMDILNAMNGSHGIVVELMDSPTKATELMDEALVIVGPNASMFGANHPDPGPEDPAHAPDGQQGRQHDRDRTRPPGRDRSAELQHHQHHQDRPPAGRRSGDGHHDGDDHAQPPAHHHLRGVGPDAIKIAVGPQNTTTYSIVGYEKGGDMGGGRKAPARRVGFFWHRPAGVTPKARSCSKPPSTGCCARPDQTA